MWRFYSLQQAYTEDTRARATRVMDAIPSAVRLSRIRREDVDAMPQGNKGQDCSLAMQYAWPCKIWMLHAVKRQNVCDSR